MKRLRSRHRARVFTIALFAAAALGCGAEPPPQGPQVGALAPPYAAVSLAGDTVSLESLRGRVVLLNLWATWCIPCRTETPLLESLHERYGDEGLTIVGASMDNRAGVEQIADFASNYGVEYMLLHDPQMRGMDLFRVFGLPGNFLIDREGRIQWMDYGAMAEGDPEFAAALEKALR